MKKQHPHSFLLFPLQVVVICAGVGLAASQITVERGDPPRNLTPAPRQQNLPPEKKKSLSKYGPEDAFPGTVDQDNRDRQSSRGDRRRSSSTRPSPTPDSTPTPTPTPETRQTPPPTTAPTVFELKPRPTATAIVAGVALSQPSGPESQSAAPEWLLPSLGLFSLMVLSALIYVLIRLFDKLRKGSKI